MSRQRIWLRRADDWQLEFAINTTHPGRVSSRNPVYISAVRDNGTEYQDSRLQVGDRVFKVNGRSFIGLTHHQAVEMIAKSGDTMELEVAKFEFAHSERRNKKTSKPSMGEEQSPLPDTQNQVWPQPQVTPEAHVPDEVGNGLMNNQDVTDLMMNIMFAFSVLLIYVELFMMELS